jgi:hypothetical protein
MLPAENRYALRSNEQTDFLLKNAASTIQVAPAFATRIAGTGKLQVICGGLVLPSRGVHAASKRYAGTVGGQQPGRWLPGWRLPIRMEIRVCLLLAYRDARMDPDGVVTNNHEPYAGVGSGPENA